MTTPAPGPSPAPPGRRSRPLRVLLDGSAFFRHTRSGITRYLTELLVAFDGAPSLGVEPLTPYRLVANRHLTESLPGRFRRLPLPPQLRGRTFERLQRAAEQQAAGAADLVHHALYLPPALEQRARRRVCTVYDFTFELHPELFGHNPTVQAHLADKQLYLERCDGLLCISHTTLADLRRWRPDLDVPCAVTPLGVSPAFAAARRPVRPPVPGPYLLHVGNRHAHKNVQVLFDAFARLARDHRELSLVLCGNGLPDEQARLEAAGIRERTRVVRVSDRDLPALYAGAAAFVFPSRYEGFGLPALEAMAAGCPVVVAEAPALLEVAEGASLTFDPSDTDALAGALDRVLGDDGLRRELVAAGRDRAADFSWARTAERTAAAYRAILSEA